MNPSGDPEAPLPGTILAGHRIEAELGHGGMGVVYRARHIALDQPRALKLIDPRLAGDEEAGGRFRREAQLAAAIEHPAVVLVHDAGEEGGRLYISMQLIDGVDLAALLESGSISPARSITILGQVAGALDAAHAAGLVHRDVKPENVLIADDGGAERAYLTDFGIGLLLAGGRDTRLTAESQVIGTSDYMAPEQIEAEAVDGRADVYALACLAFRMLTGSVPFPASSGVATLVAHRTAPRPSACALAPRLPAGVDAALARGMAVDPAERFATAGELVAELRSALGAASAEAAAPTRRMSAQRLPGPRRHTAALLAAALAVVIAVAILILVVGGSDSTSEPQPASISFGVRTRPVAVAAGAKYVWTLSRRVNRITAYDQTTGERAGLGYPADEPRAAALVPGALWVVTAHDLLRAEPDGSGVRAAHLDLADATDVVVDRRGVWVLDRGGIEPRALRIDPETLEVTGTVFVGDDPQSLAAGAGAIWVANTGNGTVSEIDPRRAHRMGNPIQVGGRPTDIAAGGGKVWVADSFNGRLIPIDAGVSPPQAGDAIETLPQPRGLVAGFGSVWVGSQEDGVLQRFDAAGNHSVQGAWDVGDGPVDVSIGAGRIWTADWLGNSVSGVDAAAQR